MFQGPTLRQLEYVLALAKLGTFTRAARHCAVSQPALSKQIQEVEAWAGGALFERARPRALLTPRGERFVESARQIVQLARSLQDAMMLMDAGHLIGEVHLGVIPTLAPCLLPGLLGRLRVAHPEATFILHEAYTDVLRDRLVRGELDVALWALPVVGDGLEHVTLYEEPFALLAPRDHALASSRALDARALRGEELLLMDEGHCFRDQALEVCASTHARERARIRAGSLSTLVRMVEAGVGATLIPALALLSEVHEPEALRVRFFAQAQAPHRSVGLGWRATSPRREVFGAMAEIFREHAQALSQRLRGWRADAPGLTMVEG